MAERNIMGRIVGVLVMVAVCFLLFDVPASYAIGRGAPWWAALAIGLVAFPVLPLAWNLASERNRPNAPNAKTTRLERVIFRTIVVALVVVGGLFAIASAQTWRSLKRHGTWFVPRTVARLDPDSPLLRRVPESAKGIVWLRDTSDGRALFSKLLPGKEVDSEVVVASDGNHVFAAERGELGLVEMLGELIDQLNERGATNIPSVKTLPDGSREWRPGDWAEGSGPPAALLDRMRLAPETAVLVGVIDDPKQQAVGHGWIAFDGTTIELVGEVTGKLTDAERAEHEYEDALREHADAYACWKKAGGEGGLEREGATLRLRLAIGLDDVVPLVECLDKTDVKKLKKKWKK